MHKAGFVNIVGNPNVGKSTLMNLLVGEHISIATFKAQTTRHRIMGNVELSVQKEFFRLLPCTRIGLTLMDTLIMSPEKSVTAFIGVLPE